MTLPQAFEQGLLVRPSDNRPNLVHLVRAIASLAGVLELDHAPPVRELIALLSPGAEHLVFILLDGLGMNLLKRMPAGSFLARHLRTPINAASPSTTACALNSVTTAQYPNRHGIAGWFTYLPDLGVTATVLPFTDRATGQPLTSKGIRVEQVFPLSPICPRMARHALTIVPALLADTTFNVYSRGGTSGFGYASIHQAMEQIVTHVREAHSPTYTHLYLPEIDTMCHHEGVTAPQVMTLIQRIDAELTQLHERLHGRARIVVTADHGLIDVPPADQTLLHDGDELLDFLAAPPSGDARMPIFHLRGPDRREDFVAKFHERFDDRMILLPTDDVERMELFGPGSFAATARPRFGDYVAVPYRPAALAYHPPNRGAPGLSKMYLAVHAGMSSEEMWVPMCVA